MQYFISTFIIMLICIIALLQDKSYDSGVILPRPQTRPSYPRNHQLHKCNRSTYIASKIQPQLIATEDETQTEALAALLKEADVNRSILNRKTVVITPQNPNIHSNTEKTADYADIFCSQCNLNLFALPLPFINNSLRSFKIRR